MTEKFRKVQRRHINKLDQNNTLNLQTACANCKLFFGLALSVDVPNQGLTLTSVCD